jgi:hypothetical protein
MNETVVVLNQSPVAPASAFCSLSDRVSKIKTSRHEDDEIGMCFAYSTLAPRPFLSRKDRLY